MWKRSLFFTVFLSAVLGASSCGGPSNYQVCLKEEFGLSIGQHASIAGEDLAIRFKEVIEDSRCPRDVTCVWAGRVSCLVELVHSGSSYQMILTEPGLTEEYADDRYQEYNLAFHVTPYPEASKEIAKDNYRLHLIISKLPELTETVGLIIAEPSAYGGKDVAVIGYYRGWDLLHEAGSGPPVTRSDWVIKDLTGAIYISANSEATVPQGLRPDSFRDTEIILNVKGIVRVTKDGQAYIEAKSIQRAH